MIHIALCFYDRNGRYYLNAAATATSVFAHTKRPITFHIVTDASVADEHKQIIATHIRKHGHECLWYDAPCLPIPITRFLLHAIIPVSKILYIDCDVICDTDIAPIYDIDLAGKPFAAVPDQKVRWPHVLAQRVRPGRYVNAGVLLLNLECFAAHAKEVERALGNKGRAPRNPHDILNRLGRYFNYDIVSLDERYNYMTGFEDRRAPSIASLRDKVIHFAVGKPWEKFSVQAFFYWQNFNKTPWGENWFDIAMQTSCDLVQEGLAYSHKRRRPRYILVQNLREYGVFRMLKRHFAQSKKASR